MNMKYDAKEFIEAARDFFKKRGSQDCTPEGLLDIWKEFTADCQKGCQDTYDDGIHECQSARSMIQALLDNKDLLQFTTYHNYKPRVLEVDEEYKKLLQPGIHLPIKSGHWWKTGVLKYAGKEYCDYMKKHYNIDVEEIEF